MRKFSFLKILIILSLLISCTQGGGLGVAPGEVPEAEGLPAPEGPQDSLPEIPTETGGLLPAGPTSVEAGIPVASVPTPTEGSTSGAITSTPGTLICNKGGLGAMMQTEADDILQGKYLCVNVDVLKSSGDYGPLADENLDFSAQVFNTITQEWQSLPKCGQKNEGPNFIAVVFQVKILLFPQEPTSDYCRLVGSHHYAISAYYQMGKTTLMGREEDLESSAPLTPDYVDPFWLLLSQLNPVPVLDGPIRTPPSPFE